MRSSFARYGVAALWLGFALYSLLFGSQRAWAGDEALTVAVYDAPPYGGVEHGGAFNGASVDLWRRIAESCGFRYRFVAVRKMDAILSGLRERRFDVAIGAITITPDRAEQVDFSYPAHRSGVAVATRRPTGVLSALTSYCAVAFDLGSMLVLAAGIMVLVGVLMWFIERPRQVAAAGEGSSVGSLPDGVYWAVVTMTTVGYGDKTPKTRAGRAVAIFWMLGSVALISILSSSLISRLTAVQIEDGASFRRADLDGKRLAAAALSSGAEYLETQGLAYGRRDSLQQALEALDKDEVDVVVNSVGALRHAVSARFSATLTVQRDLLAPAYMAFAFPANSALKKPIDRALIRVTATPEWRSVEESYFIR
ncbi:hypothetical protein CCR94_09235 [Rhodoblastus sphagnicola]|uniref:Solute-binding protein family 3/N-terminal domain-containing protein n=1 Tax=Rhodoblastus sphagnicola TaxID=333368 RepID=A0A2S6NA25_9HYPH|nr:transporter substrate-binding domain-containing protein [Rhodoblastus sphagnicola]MBB4198850.1 ABC-type amino acid transport substrate-binding protein [Rhodoblastus sphagnicola]PPQ31472.1 hypothetical protein CCR94_09235 [Rhodoblastus sphagnicola]